MTDHINNWINAYLDGELQGKRLALVESHLDECAECRDELASLQALSGLLHEAPLPDFPSAERFAANIALNLPRKSETPLTRTVLEIAWWLTPVALAAVWIFAQTTLLLSDWIGAANGLGLLDTTATAWLAPAAPQETLLSALISQAGLLSDSGVQLLQSTAALFDSTLAQVIWQVSIGLLYLAWIATWWARFSRRGYGQPLAAGSRPQVK
jgi:anti-sigma factor RsiW